MTIQEKQTISLALTVLEMTGCDVEGDFENGWNIMSGDMFGSWDCISVETVHGLVQVAQKELDQYTCHSRKTLPCIVG